MAAIQNFIQFTVHGFVQNLPWQNTWCYSIPDESYDPDTSLTFTASDLESMTLPIWNDNGLVLGLRSRYASIIPSTNGSSVQGIRVIARTQFMLTPVQFQLDAPVVGSKVVGATEFVPTFMAGYCRAVAEDYGQSPARFFVPIVDDDQFDGQGVTSTFNTALTSLASGILNSINSDDHTIYYHVDGSPENQSGGYTRAVVARIKTEILPPNPPYKGKYSYNMPLQSGVILAYPVGNFILQPKATTQVGRKN